jgi:hypothetical protein
MQNTIVGVDLAKDVIQVCVSMQIRKCNPESGGGRTLASSRERLLSNNNYNQSCA